MLTSEEINKSYRSFASWLVKNGIHFMYYNNGVTSDITVMSWKESVKYVFKKLDTYDNKWEVIIYNYDGKTIHRTVEQSTRSIKLWLLRLKDSHYWEDN